MPNNSLPFLRGWSRDPVAVGWPFPSSPWTARRLAQATLDAAIDGGGPVLELGAGAGAVTQALIEGGCAVDQLVVVERDAELCRTLERRFHGLCVLHGNALDITELLTAARITSVSVVLSGLPMRAVAPTAAIRCYSGAFRLMPHGGAIIQYTYGYRSPVDPGRSPPRLDATFVGREWRNVPPMAIWSYRLPTPRPSTHVVNGHHAERHEWAQDHRPRPEPAAASRQKPADRGHAPSSNR